jgi:hypothetical protein
MSTHFRTEYPVAYMVNRPRFSCKAVSRHKLVSGLIPILLKGAVQARARIHETQTLNTPSSVFLTASKSSSIPKNSPSIHPKSLQRTVSEYFCGHVCCAADWTEAAWVWELVTVFENCHDRYLVSAWRWKHVVSRSPNAARMSRRKKDCSSFRVVDLADFLKCDDAVLARIVRTHLFFSFHHGSP